MYGMKVERAIKQAVNLLRVVIVPRVVKTPGIKYADKAMQNGSNCHNCISTNPSMKGDAALPARFSKFGYFMRVEADQPSTRFIRSVPEFYR